jgi:hypothetical protein
MALLRPRHERRRTSIRERPFTTLSCPYNGHQVSWCRQLCEPIDGLGTCGRIAAHGMLGRTQLAILDYSARKAERLRSVAGGPSSGGEPGVPAIQDSAGRS